MRKGDKAFKLIHLLNYSSNFFYLLLSSSFQILVTMTARDGRISRLENIFLRGGNIKYIVLPELLKSAPILKKIQSMKSKAPADAAGKGGMGAGAKKQKK